MLQPGLNRQRDYPASASAFRATVVLLVLFCALAALLAPFARAPGPQLPGFNGFFAGAVFVADLATSVLLFMSFRQTLAPYVLVLACAYLHTAMMAVAYILTFPGAVRPDGPLIGTAQSVSWIFTSWTLGYALLALAAIVAAFAEGARVPRPLESRIRLGASALTAGVAAGIVAVATQWADRLPPLVIGAAWTSADAALSNLTVAAFVCGVVLIVATRHRRNELLLWLAVALAAMVVGNFLSTIGGGRYTAGWYASRLSWTISACALFLYFMGQFTRQQGLLVQTADVLAERTRERDRIWSVTEDLFGISNFQGHFLNINPAWTRLLGWSEDEIKAMHVSALRHPDDAALSNAGRARLAAGAATVRMENRFRHKDGSWRWIAWTLSTDRDLIYIAGRHVTAEKEAIEANRKAQANQAQLQKMEALGQLTGGVAHDFNNLLMVIGGNVPRVRKALADDAKVARAVDAIEIAANRGKSLTRQLLSFSRRQAINPTPTSVATRTEAVQAILASSLGANFALDIRLPGDLWRVKVDTNELELALVNLTLNARDAMPKGGTITIAAANARLSGDETVEGLQGDFVAVSVKDDGFGIPADILPKVFDPFFSTKQPDKGSGLGLSQVHGFSHQSGGTTAIESRLSHGTTVTLYLPRTDGIPEARPVEQSKALAAGTALLVEDNPDVAEVTRDMLSQLGYRVHVAPDAQSALEQLDAHRIDLVLSDIVMAGPMDGLDLARTIRSRGLSLPIMLVTGYSESVSRAAPEFAVMRKPYGLDELRSGIAKLLRSPQLS